MNYKESLTAAMTSLGADPLVRFYGYGMRKGGAMGTLCGVKPEQIVEAPVAENLMVGLAIGAALTGLRPVVYFERADFLLCGADAIVNHLDKLAVMSRGEFKPGVIIRVTVGNQKKPLFTGATHTQDCSDAFREMLRMPVFNIIHEEQVEDAFWSAHEAMTRGESTMIFEYKDRM